MDVCSDFRTWLHTKYPHYCFDRREDNGEKIRCIGTGMASDSHKSQALWRLWILKLKDTQIVTPVYISGS